MFRSIMKLLLVKVESVYGTDSVPVVGTDAVQALNLKIDYKGDKLERNTQRTSLSQVSPVTGKRWIEITFDMELKGSGSVGVVPALSDLLRACGLAENISVGSSVTYAPQSSTMDSITMYVYDLPDAGNARLHKVTGARGNMKLDAPAGGICKLSFTMQGLYTEPTDVSAPGAPTYESTLPPIVQSSQFTFNSVSGLILQALTLDLGNKLQESDDINSAAGIHAFNITERKMAGTFAPEAVLKATQNWWADWTAATQRTLSVVLGSVAGNKVTITAPKATVDNVKLADKNGITTDDIPYTLAGNAGNDEISIVFA